jgi:catechol 2,3-dioxygenase-like lactoylglutathione lyase family enzyme
MIRSLQHIELAVPDQEVGRQFFTDFGLESREEGGRVIMRCAGRDQDQVILSGGTKRKSLAHVCLGTGEDEIGGIKKGLEAAGVKLLDAPYVGAPDGVWFLDTDGIMVCVTTAQEAPARTEPELSYNTRGYNRRLGERGCSEDERPAKPRRLGHILMFTTDLPAKVRLYSGILGMKVSDTIEGDAIAFLRNGNGGDHHVIALAQADKPGLHHSSFEFGTVDDIGLAGTNMLEKGHKSCYGLGRHVVGSNYFHYFRDPWGGLVEHFADMDQIDEAQGWPRKNWPLLGNISRWSSDGEPPGDFLDNADA